MKTIIKTLVLALTLSSVSYVASANPNAGDKKTATSYKAVIFPAANATTLNVIVQKQTGSRVQIVLKNAAGTVLHTEYLTKKEGTFKSKLNLSELVNGTYRVEVTNGADLMVKDFTISDVAPATVSRTIALN
ncbi:hypothetical protein GCM10023189_15430 [Nibrella saemangeumensis]|uniref:Secretion system C-terminal sorting domain-containing protein n=1 Tax=Nibrella saemangeumensis TaxID=1084526 RepID=A0ABP8MNG5_9BACT